MLARDARGRPDTADRLERAVRRASLAPRVRGRRLVLAVSGGRDSMALLHAAARVLDRERVIVATFDHGTGVAATRAVHLVARESATLGLPVVIGRAEIPGTTEAEWRIARHAFLSDVARRTGGVVASAHTRDDQVETVLMRVMRDAGARGLAALYAPSDVLRPLLEFSRAEVAAYAASVGARWIEDPTNVSMRHLRNRVRRDLLPALVRAAPDLDVQLLQLARAASGWRERMTEAAMHLARVAADARSVTLDAEAVERHSPAELAALWPTIAGMVGLAMDWRGTQRAAAFTRSARPGSRVPLSGGWEITRKHRAFELRRVDETRSAAGPATLLPGTTWDGWRFEATERPPAVSDSWTAWLPDSTALTVRSWQPGETMGGRKVKRYLSDAHISGARRARWPVVVAGDEIIWIPGVRRSDAATVRFGSGPGVVYRCELDDR